MAVQLPRYAALKSKYNNNYLRYMNETTSQAVQTFLQYSEDNILTPYTKYEVQQAQGDTTLVNILCCYNNKYWVSWSSNHHYIVAEAEKTEEDKSKWNCTLFQPLYDNTHKAFRFRHVYLGYNVCLYRAGAPYSNCLIARWSTPDKDLCDLSTVVDWEALHALPKHLAFIGDNGSYLKATWIQGYPYLQFSANDIGSPLVGIESFITNDGNIRLKSNFFGKFWRRSPNWIFADSTDTTTNNPDTLFWPIKIETDVFALRNLGNNNFCKRLSTEGKISCLNAGVSTIDAFSRLKLQELVLSREIYNVIFRASDSRIYNESVVAMATQTATNTTEVPNTMNLNLTYTETKSSTWTAFVSLKLGVKTNIQTGVPFIVKGRVEITTEFSGGYEWGETKTSTKQVESSYQVTVPPKTAMIVTLVATKGTCDVPYSYTQRDTLMNGEIKTYQMDDGVYYGINSYNFHYETQSRPLPT